MDLNNTTDTTANTQRTYSRKITEWTIPSFSKNKEAFVKAFVEKEPGMSNIVFYEFQQTALMNMTQKEQLQLAQYLHKKYTETKNPQLKEKYAAALIAIFFDLKDGMFPRPDGLTLNLLDDVSLKDMWNKKMNCIIEVNKVNYGVSQELRDAEPSHTLLSRDIFLEPGDNPVLIQLFSAGSPRLNIELTLNITGKGIKQQKKDFTIIYDTHAKEFAEKNMDRYCALVKRTGLSHMTLRFISDTVVPSSSFRREIKFMRTVEPHTITLLVNDTDPDTAFFHETMHAYFTKMLSPQDHAALEKIHTDLLNELSSTKDRTFTSIDEFEQYIYDTGSSILRFFDESEYMSGVSKGYGHPYDDPSELFASMMTIAFRFPEQLIQKIELCPDPQEKAKIKRTIKAVLDMYLKNPGSDKELFDKKLLDYLNT